MRRLPVYLLLDTSGSMTGEPIVAVKNGVKMLLKALRKDPYTLETAFISIITFSSSAQQVVPLTELAMLQAPELVASGMTSMGEGLKLLARKMEEEVLKSTAEIKGDWKPMVFIMTDGEPTDDWEKGLKLYQQQKVAITVACAAGEGADTNVLLQITKNVLALDTTDATRISEFFKWVSASISSGSHTVATGGTTDINDMNKLPPPPPELNIIF